MIPSQDQLHPKHILPSNCFGANPIPQFSSGQVKDNTAGSLEQMWPSKSNFQADQGYADFGTSDGGFAAHIVPNPIVQESECCCICNQLNGRLVPVETENGIVRTHSNQAFLLEDKFLSMDGDKTLAVHIECLDHLQPRIDFSLLDSSGSVLIQAQDLPTLLKLHIKRADDNYFSAKQEASKNVTSEISSYQRNQQYQFEEQNQSGKVLSKTKNTPFMQTQKQSTWSPTGSSLLGDQKPKAPLKSFFSNPFPKRKLSNTRKLEEVVEQDSRSQSLKIEINLGGSSKILGKRQRVKFIFLNYQSNLSNLQLEKRLMTYKAKQAMLTILKQEILSDDSIHQRLKIDSKQVKEVVQESNSAKQENFKEESKARDSSNTQLQTNSKDPQPELSKLKIAKSLEVNNRFQHEFVQSNDPCQYLKKEILQQIICLDRLEVLRRDKMAYKVMILQKDLKVIPRALREEILNSSKIYIDSLSNNFSTGSTFVLVIDKSQEGSRLFENSNEVPQIEADSLEQQQMEHDQAPQNDSSEVAESSPSRMDIDDSLGQKNSSPSENQESKLMIDENDSGVAQKSKKKRKKGSHLVAKKNGNVKKNLPNNLSEHPWLENSELNRELLEREKEKQIELKRQKEQQKLDRLVAQESVLEESKQANENKKTSLEMNEEMKDETTLVVVSEIRKPLTQEPKSLEWAGFKSKRDIEDLEDIWERAEAGHYHSLGELAVDLEYIVKKSIENRCVNTLAKVYLTHVLWMAINIIKVKKSDFKQKWRNYYDARYAQNDMYYPRIKASWYKEAGPKREYNLIENYKIVTPEEANPNLQNSQTGIKNKHDIIEKMHTTKTSKCQGNCCLKIEDLGPFKLGSDVWESKCPCRIARVECNKSCGCESSQCQNRQMSLKQALRLGEDVIEKISWGLDMCTAVNLMNLLPRDVPQHIQSDFIENRLVYAIQQQGIKGYDVREALKYIINSVDVQRFREMDKYFASVVLSGIKMVRDKIERHFRVHSKGIGIFCKRKEGIKANNLIIEYFGEIYQPWNWYEKQDVLKQGQNLGRLSKELPDFYNITYERHYDDPFGYDILMVDPILYGNYSSRLSHSCSPNCSTVIHIREGQYSIGMFAIKDVSFGEELCFNYCSLTESEKEYESAVCLCGTEVCQGRFLQLANDKKHQALMKKFHTFVDRNYLIFKACTQPELSEEEEQRLFDFGLKQSVLKGIPSWLKKWASLICEYIIYEEELYPKFMKQEFSTLNEEDLKIDAKNQKDGKIWNVAITVDKIYHVLKLMDTDEPPIKKMTPKEVKCFLQLFQQYMKFWHEEGTFRDSLSLVLNKLDSSPQKTTAIDLIHQLNQRVMQILSEDEIISEDSYYTEKFNDIQGVLAQISDELRPVSSNSVQIEPFCDILWLYANIHTYFTPNENYKKCRGEDQIIRKCDVRLNISTQEQYNPVNQEKTEYHGSKDYDPGYIWGQLVGWFKQTVDKPNASLSADRRGTLSMPDLESFLVTAKNQEDLKSGIKRKKGKKGAEEEDAGDLETAFLKKSGGTRSRPGAKGTGSNDNSADVSKASPPKSKGDVKVKYPHKKNNTRQAFFDNWAEHFSKQWDVCCHWNFKNKQRMYGSVQFESVLRADTDRSRRLEYFNTVVNHLRNI